ncbi:hypothetical protein [Streptomyces sp. NRRL S-340]|uniref:hypothetical protein n=1 Tax=Streptomyces sp. NRRL S-340 TaxID=1463901 RepID=UPI00099B6A50|nr:hypothetical protein [Streptomyces sp. NRRL S-340]
MSMVSLAVMFGLLAAIVVGLIVVLLRRRNGSTKNADGLLIEQASRIQARRDRSSYSTLAMHNTTPTMSDQYRRP